jgi:quinol monooxygenase YgiN
MVEHIVLFKLKPETTAEQRAQMKAELKGLRDKVPGVVDLSLGENFSERSQGFEIGLVVRFTDRQALEGYLPHPAHRACVEQFIHPIRLDTLVVDYEIG